MKPWLFASGACALALLLLQGQAPAPSVADALARHRNLGKAFYENPTTQNEAVEEFRKALALAPGSLREQLNFGLALLRAGKTLEGLAQLEKVQKTDPRIPHTWFNLGVAFKKAGEQDRAIAQFEGMLKLVPDEPISHYNLGALYRQAGRTKEAIEQFETAARLDHTLAAPHFQLYNLYRTSNRTEEARAQLQIFQGLKKQQEGAAIPEDVEWSFYAEIYDVMEDRPPALAQADVRFTARPAGAATAALVIDANADGRPELLTWPALQAAAADSNNDGFPDVCVLTASGPVLHVNQKGKLAPSPVKLPQGQFRKVLWLDYDHDYDQDLFLLGAKSVLLRNQGAAGFVDRTADFPFTEGEAVDAVAFRVLADTKGYDVVISYAARPAVLYRDELQARFEAAPMALPAGARSLTAADADNDGWLDLLYAADGGVQIAWNRQGRFEPPAPIAKIAPGEGFTLADLENRGLLDLVAGTAVYRNSGEGKFGTPRSTPGLASCSSIDAADLDADGRTDLACVTGASASVLTNATVSKNTWARVRLTGVRNLKLAPGSEVEVKAGPRYQKKTYEGLPLVFGLGDQTTIDTIRITWANGLIQNEMKQATGRTLTYQESQRLSGSCPIIWSWNGRAFEYITDVLGVAPLGASAGDGQYFPVDHDEYIQIPGKSLVRTGGDYQVRITEELSEVAYLDRIKLIAVDHPADVEIFTNDKFKGPPFPEFRLFGVKRRIAPVAARDFAGNDVHTEIAAKDRKYPDQFPRDMSGVGALHHLDLDFGSAAPGGKAILVLSGWVDWADGSTFLGVAQQGRGGLVPPYLQVKNARGEWQTVIEDMGMPAGKPKTIAVDLTGKFLTASREIRIVTNLCVYWDEIFLGSDPGAPDVRMHEMQARSADLHFRGFSPARIHPQRKQPEEFRYDGPTPVSMWNPTPGFYTRYGDVRELTYDPDDRFVVMGSGDELRLLFDATKAPGTPQGWTRDFLLLVEGWAKDRDANTAYSQHTDPLPFHRMTRFPYPANEKYPDDAAHRDYKSAYNTRPALKLLRPLAR